VRLTPPKVLTQFEGRALRNRIEHAQVIATTDISRFVDLGLIVLMQPMHATSDMNMAEDRIGPERIKRAYAWRSLLNQGATISAGSDLTVESANPFHGLPFFGSVFATPAAL